MKKTGIYSIATVLALLLTFVFPVAAADTGVVTATVTAQNVSVTVADGTVSYGIVVLNTSKSTTAGDLNDLQTATNNGNVAEDLNIKGQDTAAWTLTASAGANQYTQKFCISSCTTYPTNYTALTTSYQTLATNIATSGTRTFDLGLTTPTSTSSYTSQSVDVTVQAVAH